MREVLKDIFTWPWFSEPHGYNFNGYLIVRPQGNLVIDPVEPSDEDLAELARRGVSRILITNRNHSRACNKVRERTGAKTLIHAADAPHARSQGAVIDGELHMGVKMGPLVVIGAAGKSPGEIALHWPERRILIVGDAVVGNPPGRCSLLPEAVMDDPTRLRESVEALLVLEFDTLLTGDGEPVLKDAKARLQELVAKFPP
ncbi:MAG TPA: MBL fold metallo-hydrolase [Verrucomicrobiae bacterium]|jgi:glyoxylase-like metal-dependent hydrolase (beta-lactamase superfamily II)|nr:MBL fold metallo-hydrolase [Verrucomicrobiae bacterium]